MDRDSPYYRQVQLLFGAIPYVATENCFALKGGTAINLFDVKLLLDSDGFTREVFEGFLVYLLCSRRPMAELLAPDLKDTADAYTNHFEGMTRNPIANEELVLARDRLVADISAHMTDNDKDFLLSFKSGAPQWELMPLPVIEQLPAVQWKLLNIRRMSQKKHGKMLINLQSVLDGM